MSSRRTFLFVHPSDELYGSDRCLLEIVRGLPASDRAIVVLPADLPYHGKLSRALTEAGAEVRRIDMLVLRRSLLRPRNVPTLLRRLSTGTLQLVRVVRGEGVDLVHSNTVAVPGGALAALLTRRPHVWHVHEFLGDEPPVFRMVLRGLLALVPGVVVANSWAVARSVAGGSRRLRRKTTVIENAVFLEIEPAPAREIGPETPVRLGFLGRLTPRKGVAEALAACQLLRWRGLDVSLDLWGAPPAGQEWRLAGYQARAEELGIASAVRFRGETTDVSGVLAEMDILVVPSQRPEPFGLVVIEGLAAGLPVVVTRNGGGSDELLEDGRTGLYCGLTPPEIADAIERVIHDPDLRQALRQASREVAARRFSRVRYTARFQNLYRYCLEQVPGGFVMLSGAQRSRNISTETEMETGR
jgi:hypothetical protein